MKSSSNAYSSGVSMIIVFAREKKILMDTMTDHNRKNVKRFRHHFESATTRNRFAEIFDQFFSEISIWRVNVNENDERTCIPVVNIGAILGSITRGYIWFQLIYIIHPKKTSPKHIVCVRRWIFVKGKKGQNNK